MEKYRIGIVIPALNESATIQRIVQSSSEYGVPIVVDDGSTDGTAALALEAGGIVFSHDRNYGYDVALDSGFKKALEIGCEVVITLDADGQHDPSLIQKFIDRIDAGADVVSGVRSTRQRLAEHSFAWYTRCRYGIYDPLCGMKAYKTDVYRALGHFDSYGSIGTELIIFAVKGGSRLDQIPFEVRARTGESRFGRVLSGNYKIFRALLFSIWKIS